MLDSVKVKKLIPFIAVIMMTNLVLPLVAGAESLDALNEKEAKAEETGKSISQDINKALNDVNEKYAEIEKLKVDISKTEETIKESENQIAATETSIAKRKEAVGNRMKDVQLNGGGERTWQVLLDAESITDFFHKAYAMNVLQNAEREKIDGLSKDKERLAELQKIVKSKQTELETNEAKLQSEASVMDEQIAALKEQLANNEQVLSQITSEKQVEKNRIADVAAKAKAEEEAKQRAIESSQESASSSSSSSQNSSNSTEQTVPSQPEAPNTGNTGGGETPSTGGNVLYVQSTAYSWREGNGFITATGIDLRNQSNVIAVDPSVIPLGSIVEIEGYGVAIAGDTGGAIKGNIVDVHFDTVQQCINWGRKYNLKAVIR